VLHLAQHIFLPVFASALPSSGVTPSCCMCNPSPKHHAPHKCYVLSFTTTKGVSTPDPSPLHRCLCLHPCTCVTPPPSPTPINLCYPALVCLVT
jgi:hypothetical protein